MKTRAKREDILNSQYSPFISSVYLVHQTLDNKPRYHSPRQLWVKYIAMQIFHKIVWLTVPFHRCFAYKKSYMFAHSWSQHSIPWHACVCQEVDHQKMSGHNIQTSWTTFRHVSNMPWIFQTYVLMSVKETSTQTAMF